MYRTGRVESHLTPGRPRADGAPHIGPWHSVKQYIRGRGDDKSLQFQVRLKTSKPGKTEYSYYPVPFAVLMMFGPPRPSDDAVVVYKDGDIENCHIDNLAWVERAELPKYRKQVDLSKWVELYRSIAEQGFTPESIAQKEGMSLASAINKLRVAKVEYDRQCRSAAQSSSSD